MADFSSSKLAFHLDRKILELQEEDYYRLDLSAHESADVSVLELKVAKSFDFSFVFDVFVGIRAWIQGLNWPKPKAFTLRRSKPKVTVLKKAARLSGPKFSFAKAQKSFRSKFGSSLKCLRQGFKGASNDIKRFVISALLIYLALFSITNAAAYSKIIKASVSDFMDARELAHLEEIAQIEALFSNTLHSDPWTGERIAQHIEEAQPIAALTEGFQSNDGILPLSLDVIPPDNRVVIESLGIDAPFQMPDVSNLVNQEWDILNDNIAQALTQGVVHYPGSAKPGQDGNFFVTGHSSNNFWVKSPFNTVFARLPQIDLGETIKIYYEGQLYLYEVFEIVEVSPKDVSILSQDYDEEILTAVTCTPVGTTLFRTAVKAKRVN